MCLLRKYGLTMLPIFRHFFHFPKQRLCYPHQTLHPLRGHKKRSLQISLPLFGKGRRCRLETSQGTGVLDPVIKMEDFDWLGRLTAGMRSEGAKVGAVFFCQRSISAQPFFQFIPKL